MIQPPTSGTKSNKRSSYAALTESRLLDRFSSYLFCCLCSQGGGDIHNVLDDKSSCLMIPKPHSEDRLSISFTPSQSRSGNCRLGPSDFIGPCLDGIHFRLCIDSFYSIHGWFFLLHTHHAHRLIPLGTPTHLSRRQRGVSSVRPV